jgi:glycosyltransferase involved in cell wall biosynthesis
VVIEALKLRLAPGFRVVAGSSSFEPSITLAFHEPELVLIRNVYLAKRRLLWQRGVAFRLLLPDVALLELNPRIISSWSILIMRRMLRRPTVLWGHAWPRTGPGSRSDLLRGLMRRLASAVVVYTETQAAQLSPLLPGKIVRAAPNALYPERAAVAVAPVRPAKDVVYVGRLVDAKRPGLLLEAFLAALPDLPEETSLVFVGDGELREQLEGIAEASAALGRVRFTGTVTEFDALERIYESALVSVSPGYVGLSLIQSFWFGVPAIIARDEPHSPEIEAADEALNSVFVPSGSAPLLAEAIVRVFEQRSKWLASGPSIAEDCVARYSAEAMVESIASVVEAVRP